MFFAGLGVGLLLAAWLVWAALRAGILGFRPW